MYPVCEGDNTSELRDSSKEGVDYLIGRQCGHAKFLFEVTSHIKLLKFPPFL